MDNKIQKMLKTATEYLVKIEDYKVENMPLYPTVVIFCESITSNYYVELSENLRLNWGRFVDKIPFIKIFYNGDALYAKDLRTGEEGQVLELCQKMINQMLMCPSDIFPDRTRMKIDCLISSEDKWENYQETIAKIGNSYAMTTLKTLYLMAEQETPEKQDHTKAFIEKLQKEVLAFPHNFTSIYLLSNYLKNNRILGEDKLGENYRLVANLILLGGNFNGNSKEMQTASEIYEGAVFKTASYAIKQKPLHDIVVYSIQYMLKEIMRRQKEGYSSWEDTQKKLGIDVRKVDFFETKYREIQKNLPGKECVYGFPKLNGKFSGSLKDFEYQTYGISTLFFKRYFLEECIDKWLLRNGEKSIKELIEQWEKTLSFAEIKNYFGCEELGDSIAKINILVPGTNESLQGRIYARFQEEAKKYFYDRMCEMLLRGLQKEYDKCISYEKVYCDFEMKISDDMQTSKRESLENCYNQEINAFLDREQEAIYRDFLDLNGDEEKLIEKVMYWFRKLVEETEVYKMSFEDELIKRMGEKSEKDRQHFLKDELFDLEKELKQSRRINLLHDPSVEYVYYMINKQAEYAKLLASNHTDERIFHLDRTYCIEKIAVANIDDIKYINYMGEEKNG